MFSAELSTHEGDDHVVVALRGELDMADAASIAATLTEIAARGPTIIVNLEAVDFMDSSGVAALARGRRQARQAGGDLVLAAAQQQVLRMLSLTRLADAFAVHVSVDEAIFGPGQATPACLPAASWTG
jgi:anti-sigma B factor antagonist